MNPSLGRFYPLAGSVVVAAKPLNVAAAQKTRSAAAAAAAAGGAKWPTPISCFYPKEKSWWWWRRSAWAISNNNSAQSLGSILSRSDWSSTVVSFWKCKFIPWICLEKLIGCYLKFRVGAGEARGCFVKSMLIEGHKRWDAEAAAGANFGPIDVSPQLVWVMLPSSKNNIFNFVWMVLHVCSARWSLWKWFMPFRFVNSMLLQCLTTLGGFNSCIVLNAPAIFHPPARRQKKKFWEIVAPLPKTRG